MKTWNSVVGKLWFTILLLVTFVLFVLTIFLLEIFENYDVKQVKDQLSSSATKVAKVLENQEQQDIGLEIALQIVDDPSKVMVATSSTDYQVSGTKTTQNNEITQQILANKHIKQAFKGKTIAPIEIKSSGPEGKNRYKNYIVTARPVTLADGSKRTVIVYQSLAVLQDTTAATTKIILIAAGIAIILTTIFAFFLSSRIAAPLRKMREAVSEVMKGKFDTKIPILTKDEIGELATSFNQMVRQLNINLNALKHEKEQIKSILSSMADGVITFNSDGTILIINPPAERVLQQWYNDCHDDSKPVPDELLQLLNKVFTTEKEQIGEMTILNHYYVMIISPLYNQDSIRGAVAVIRNMTEENKVKKMRDDFIANVSHELRTPISMLQGYSEAIIDGVATNEEEVKEFSRIIYEETLRIGRLVNDLLNLAKMEAGHMVLHKEDTEIAPYIERIVHKFQGLAKENEIQLLYTDTNEQTAHINFDPDRIEQVLTNLIDNAIRHTPANGEITVTTTNQDGGVLFSVSDNGIGINEEDLPFVFERFYKADKARTRGKAGTGLGLAIAKNMIEAHEGNITVDSKMGQGTTFSFFLPYN